MKQFLILSVLLFQTDVFAQAPKGKAKVGTNYGQTINEKNALPAPELYQMVSQGDTVNVKVQAVVLSSCKSEGCWLTFRVNDSTEALAKMKDHAFFVPLDIKGKTVVIEGKSYLKTTSVKELKHIAEDAKKPKKEIDAITQPKKQVILIASGVLVIQP